MEELVEQMKEISPEVYNKWKELGPHQIFLTPQQIKAFKFSSLMHQMGVKNHQGSTVTTSELNLKLRIQNGMSITVDKTNERILEGIFQNGKNQGVCRIISHRGVDYITFEDGMKQGLHRSFGKDGNYTEIQFKNDFPYLMMIYQKDGKMIIKDYGPNFTLLNKKECRWQ